MFPSSLLRTSNCLPRPCRKHLVKPRHRGTPRSQARSYPHGQQRRQGSDTFTQHWQLKQLWLLANISSSSLLDATWNDAGTTLPRINRAGCEQNWPRLSSPGLHRTNVVENTGSHANATSSQMRTTAREEAFKPAGRQN